MVQHGLSQCIVLCDCLLSQESLCQRSIIGRVQKIAVEKKQAYYQPQVSTGKRRPYRALIAVYFRVRSVTSGNYAGGRPVGSFGWNHRPICLAFTQGGLAHLPNTPCVYILIHLPCGHLKLTL